jgi:hypothetical protein
MGWCYSDIIRSSHRPYLSFYLLMMTHSPMDILFWSVIALIFA